MKVTVRRMDKTGDTAVVVEGAEKILEEVETLLRTPGSFLAVDGHIVSSPQEAMEKIAAVEEAELILGKQVAGG